jgi:hypothetical protein
VQSAALIAGLASAAALVASLIFLARQSKESARQTRLANELAGTQAMAASFETVDHIVEYFLEYPDLRRYFYDNAELAGDAAAADSPVRARVLTLAELFADTLQSAFFTIESIEAVASYRDNMLNYVTVFLRRSPVLRQTVSENPVWWPTLAEELERLPPHSPSRR